MPSAPIGLGVPVSSNNRANAGQALGGVGGAGNVDSLNDLFGNVVLASSASVSVADVGDNSLAMSTDGLPQNVGALTATGVTTPGTVSASQLTTSAGLSVGGTATIATLIATVMEGGTGTLNYNSGQVGQQTCHSVRIGPLLVAWGYQSGTSGSQTLQYFQTGYTGPTFASPPAPMAIPQQNGTVNGYATITGSPSTTGFTCALTTTAGGGFGTGVYYIAVGQALQV
jgi:hypothetical protein